MKISAKKKAKLKARFNPDLHPRYPEGHPQGGQFMPSGSLDYNLSKLHPTIQHMIAFSPRANNETQSLSMAKKMASLKWSKDPFLQSAFPNEADYHREITAWKKAVKDGKTHPVYSAFRSALNKSPQETGLILTKTAREKIKRRIKADKLFTNSFPKLNKAALPIIDKKEIVGEHTVSIRIRHSLPDAALGSYRNDSKNIDNGRAIASVAITVNNKYSKTDIEGKVALRVALKARSMIFEEVKRLPDGTLLTNSPFDGDGFGKSRFDVYKKAGFSDDMTAIVHNGKIKPITLKEIRRLEELNHVTE